MIIKLKLTNKNVSSHIWQEACHYVKNRYDIPCGLIETYHNETLKNISEIIKSEKIGNWQKFDVYDNCIIGYLELYNEKYSNNINDEKMRLNIIYEKNEIVFLTWNLKL